MTLRYIGVTLEKLTWSMRIWEMFSPDRFDASAMIDALLAIRKNFNTVRLQFGYKHIVRRNGYLDNLIRTIRLAKAFGLNVYLSHWPVGLHPEDKGDDYSGRTGEMTYVQYSPVFDVAVRRECLDGMLLLAQAIRDHGLASSVLCVDLHNEANGHLTGRYDQEVMETSHTKWGYIHDWTAPFFQDWLITKYSSVSGLNDVWGSAFSAFSDIPIFHTWQLAKAVMTQPSIAVNDQKDWIQIAWRDWVIESAAAIRNIDNGIRIGCSTAVDQEHLESKVYYGVRSSEICTQAVIAPHVDILDNHMYGSVEHHARHIASLREQYPELLIIHGETHNKDNEVEIAIDSGSDGVIAWSTGGPPGRDITVHSWEDWSLLPFGIKFISNALF